MHTLVPVGRGLFQWSQVIIDGDTVHCIAYSPHTTIFIENFTTLDQQPLQKNAQTNGEVVILLMENYLKENEGTTSM